MIFDMYSYCLTFKITMCYYVKAKRNYVSKERMNEMRQV
jgi:hypothetical protein